MQQLKAKLSPAQSQRIIAMMDLTRLQDGDDAATITQFCQQAQTPYGCVAAVCVYPEFVSLLQQQRGQAPWKIATTANFPTGTAPLEATLAEIRQAIDDGADEIDLVMPYTLLLENKPQTETISDYLTHCRQACGELTLKVILETGRLSAPLIQLATELALASGADFVKTSTGKVSINATLDAAKIMLTTLKSNSQTAGLKVAGGIRTAAVANAYCQLVTDTMGEAWLNPQHFRIGASTLLADVLQHTE